MFDIRSLKLQHNFLDLWVQFAFKKKLNIIRIVQFRKGGCFNCFPNAKEERIAENYFCQTQHRVNLYPTTLRTCRCKILPNFDRALFIKISQKSFKNDITSSISLLEIEAGRSEVTHNTQKPWKKIKISFSSSQCPTLSAVLLPPENVCHFLRNQKEKVMRSKYKEWLK